MIKVEGGRGSEAQAKPLVVGKDTVYVHTNIEHITGAEIDEYQYDSQYHHEHSGRHGIAEVVDTSQHCLHE